MDLLQKILLMGGLIASLFNLQPNLVLLTQAIIIGIILAVSGLIALNRFFKSRRLSNDIQLTGDKI